MNAVAIDFEQFVQINHSEPVTTSEFVAKAFGKKHCNVLAKIEEICTQVPDSFIKLNFKFNEKLVKVGFGERRDKFYELTKDGFMLLVMGFTGKNAMSIKIAYINAFNAIVEKLRQIQTKQYIATSNLNSQTGGYMTDVTLTRHQRTQIKRAVVLFIGQTGRTAQEVYKLLYARFGVQSYQDIPARHFDEAMSIIDKETQKGRPCILLDKTCNNNFLLHVENGAMTVFIPSSNSYVVTKI